MNLDDFRWHPADPANPTSHGMHLRLGGSTGQVYAATTVMEGESWLAILNLHLDSTKVFSVACGSEDEAIEVAERWLERMLAART